MTIPTFPTLAGIGYPVKRTPIWSTIKQQSISGLRTRLALWTYPSWAYDLPYSVLRADSTAEWQTLAGFYNQMRGPAGVFQFNDPNDDAVTAQPFGTGDGTTTVFQLVRTLGAFTEPVFNPISIAAFVAGVPTSISPGSHGLVVFASPPASGAALTWTGTYSWVCRFDDDQVEFQNFAQNFWEAQSIKFTTERF
jgi:uncharacterized protein (TIGR02217 family)